MAKKKVKAAPRKANSGKKVAHTKDKPVSETEDAKALAEKIFANLKKPE